VFVLYRRLLFDMASRQILQRLDPSLNSLAKCKKKPCSYSKRQIRRRYYRKQYYVNTNPPLNGISWQYRELTILFVAKWISWMCKRCYQAHEKNDFAERSKILLDIDLKIILLDQKK